MEERQVVKLIKELASRIGPEAFGSLCLDLMAGADRNHYVEELRSLTGFAWEPGDSVFDHSKWPDYWVRSWGARGLLHVWDVRATDAGVAGLGDEHWRPAEMCLKVVERSRKTGPQKRLAWQHIRLFTKRLGIYAWVAVRRCLWAGCGLKLRLQSGDV